MNEQSRPQTRRYESEEIAVVWRPGLCIHSGNCVAGLPNVFDPSKRPWVAVDAAPTDELVATIRNCPSGALTFERLK